ncbi:DUF6538 domain-containing protein [Bradyrhizobium sp. ISRA442]|uniref:DUF6538 domain-containing protein n=1 Tax=Bradyrhizobium sp. ISRA442 TaxID=2866197 RepID=UPI00311B16FE
MARPWPHPATGIFWFRMAVPLKLRPIVNKREEKCSLKTRDPEEAKIRHALKAAEVRRRWSGLKEGVRSLSQKEAPLALPAPRRPWILLMACHHLAIELAGQRDRNANDDYSEDPKATRFPEWQGGAKPEVTSIVAAFKVHG